MSTKTYKTHDHRERYKTPAGRKKLKAAIRTEGNKETKQRKNRCRKMKPKKT